MLSTNKAGAQLIASEDRLRRDLALQRYLICRCLKTLYADKKKVLDWAFEGRRPRVLGRKVKVFNVAAWRYRWDKHGLRDGHVLPDAIAGLYKTPNQTRRSRGFGPC